MGKKKHKMNQTGGKYSSLDAHKLTGKKLVPPFAQFDSWLMSSWVNDQLPEMLWVSLVASALPREHCIVVFRRIARCAEKYMGSENANFGVTHSALSRMEEEDFRRIVAVLLSHPFGRVALRPLLLFPDLPGFQRWEAALGCSPDIEDWNTLSNAIIKTLDHQSQQSTDCRWLTVLINLLIGKLNLRNRESIREYLEYPDYGDQKKVRPSIRATEILLRNASEENFKWPEVFWSKCFTDTECIYSSETGNRLPSSKGTTVSQVTIVGKALKAHAFLNITTTAVDARHDASFGFSLYALNILEELMRLGNAQSVFGRFGLRSLVECYITFRYLSKKDDLELWKSYRVYGSGQAKLAFLKLEEASGDIAESFDKQVLELLANEDMQQEFLPINLGHWDNSTLRKLSEQADCKDIYDAYYTWTSSYIHGHWSSMRDVCFTTCMNPLHRAHRIPRQVARTLEDVVPDACKLVDGILDTLDSIYPGFTNRVSLDT